MYDKAVSLLVLAGYNSQALELCLKYNVRVDDHIIEKMVPENVSDANGKELLRQIARLCKRQG